MRQTLALLMVLFVGCAARQPNATGTPPPGVQVATLSRTLADTLHASNETVKTLRDEGKISQADTTIVQNYLVIAASAGKEMDAELMSADPWPMQAQKITSIWARTSIGIAAKNLSPPAAAILDNIINIVNQVMAAIGGPVL
jgi:hypothetical protein